jgi:lipid-A-disaccharide synthase
MGRHLVNVPFYSMVNLVAQREIIPELIQQACTPQALADAALHLLNDAGAATRMRDGLQQVAHQLASHQDPIAQGALIVLDILRKEGSNAIS